MTSTISHATLVWRLLIAALVIGARLALDGLVPRGWRRARRGSSRTARFTAVFGRSQGSARVARPGLGDGPSARRGDDRPKAQ